MWLANSFALAVVVAVDVAAADVDVGVFVIFSSRLVDFCVQSGRWNSVRAFAGCLSVCLSIVCCLVFARVLLDDALTSA